MVEDSLALSSLLSQYLAKFYVVDVALDLERAKFLIDSKDYDLFIFDLILADGSTKELCPIIQENKLETPLLFLTAETANEHKDFCLQHGSDYLAKPFTLVEFEARVKKLLARSLSSKAADSKDILSLPNAAFNLQVDEFKHQVVLTDRQVFLNRKEFALLALFMRYPAKIFSKAALAERVWQEESVLFSNSIEATITHLRRKLGKNIIRAVKGVGYALQNFS